MLKVQTRPKTLILFLLCSMMATPLALAQDGGASSQQGTVVFTRADKFKGKAIRFNMNQNGQPVGQLLAGSTLELKVDPGTYTYTVWSPSLDGQDSLTIDVQAGYTYHVEGVVLWGYPAGRAKFRLTGETGPGPSSVAASGNAAPAGQPDNALAGAALGNVAASSPTVEAGERGRLGLRSFAGDWELDVWSLAADGSKLRGEGMATGAVDDAGNVVVTITEFSSSDFAGATGGGEIEIAYDEQRGFSLVTDFQFSEEVLQFSGQFDGSTGVYTFYLFGSSAGTIATGAERTSVQVEIRSLDPRSWLADTWSSVDGQRTHVQSYRFTRQ